jgi:hypothetical protein
MACFGVANDEIPIRSTITLYSGALPLATGSDISPQCTVPGRQQSLFRELLRLDRFFSQERVSLLTIRFR